MELTFDEAVENHRKMWNWIADETEKRGRIVLKQDYFEENNIKEHVMCSCYCCQYTLDNNKCEKIFNLRNCLICPIDWGVEPRDSSSIQCDCVDNDDLTAYQLWIESTNFNMAAKYAREIANLPTRKL